MKKRAKILAILIAAVSLSACGAKEKKSETVSSGSVMAKEASSSVSSVSEKKDGGMTDSVSASSANASASSEARAQFRGYIDGKTFKNDFFGVKLDIPEGAEDQTAQQGVDLAVFSDLTMYLSTVSDLGVKVDEGMILEASKSYMTSYLTSGMGMTDVQTSTEELEFLGEKRKMLVMTGKAQGMDVAMIDAVLMKDGKMGQFMVLSLKGKDEAVKKLADFKKI